MAARVLRLLRLDELQKDEAPYLLVYVAPTSKHGSAGSLDLTLYGTEGAAPYGLKLQSKKTATLKENNKFCTADEWNVILEAILLGKKPDDAEFLKNVEVLSALEPEIAITISIRKKFDGNITQKLGTLKLTHDENITFDLFDWCGVAIDSASSSATDLSELMAKVAAQELTVRKLKDQLEDLTKEKAANDSAMIEKFRLLLNEKKLKIRNQSRALAFSNIDAEKLNELELSGYSHWAEGSRSSKRKIASGGSNDSEDGAFQVMGVDEEKKLSVSESDRVVSSTETDEETSDEEIDTGGPDNMSRKATVLSPRVTTSKDISDKAQGSGSTPTKRQLPFSRKVAPSKKYSTAASKTKAKMGDETESDDEL